MEDLVNCFFGWKVYVLDDICPVDKRGIYNADSRNEGVGSFLFCNAPIALGRLLVAITRTFFLCLSLSSCVRSALTTYVW